MSNESPAAILYDISGNEIGVLFDGVVYRLQTDARLTDGTNTVGITNVLGNYALKVDVIKTVASGGAGSGGTSSNFADPFPIAGTAAGYSDGYYMQDARVFDLDTSPTTDYVLGTNLRTYAPGGSIETGVSGNPLHVAVDGYVQTNPSVILYDTLGNPVTVTNGAIAVSELSSTGTITSVGAVNTDTLLLAANPDRRGVFFYNDTTSAPLRIALSTSAASATNFSVLISAGGLFEIPFGYTGMIRGIWSVNDASGYVRITELN